MFYSQGANATWTVRGHFLLSLYQCNSTQFDSSAHNNFFRLMNILLWMIADVVVMNKYIVMYGHCIF